MSAAAAKRTVLVAASIAAALGLAAVMPAAGATDPDGQAPSTPTNMHVTSATQSSVTVAWDPSTDNVGVAGYYVWGDQGKVGLGERAKIAVDAPRFTVTGLGCGRSAVLTVAAFDAAGNRSARVSTGVATSPCLDTQPPTAPKGFIQAATTKNSVILTWTPSYDNTGVVGYDLYRDLLLAATPSSPSATLSNLSCGTTYPYSVDAVDAAGNHSPRASVYVRTAACSDQAPDTTPPSSPTSLSASNVTSSGLLLSWSASSDNVAVTGYDVYRNGTKVGTSTSNSSSQTGLTCGTSYTFGVAARDAAGNSSAKASLNVSTSACSSPTTPTWTSSIADGQSVPTGTNWIATVSPTPDSVEFWATPSGGANTKLKTDTGPNYSVVLNLTPGTYLLGACAVYGTSRTCFNDRKNVTIVSTPTPSPSPSTKPDTTPPSTPSSVAVSTTTQTAIGLTWAASSDNVGVQGYRVYVNGAYAATSAHPGTTVSGLACGTAYTLAVEAFDAKGNASSRASVTGSTSPCADTQAPSVPSSVAATSRTTTSIALSWSASTDNVGVAGYGLYQGGTQQGTTASTTAIFSGLVCNTNYTLALDAYDAAGNHSTKVTLMVSTTSCPDTTPPTAPTSLTASNVTASSLTLGWSPSSDNTGVTGYDVYKGGTVVANVPATSSAQSGLACGTSYNFGVVARDAAGNSSAMASLSPSTASCPAPTWTSSIADGAAVLAGTTWTATVAPLPDSVEFWDTPSGGASNKLATDTSAPYSVALNLPAGTYVLGVCAWYGTSRTCFDDRKTMTITSASPSTPSTSSYYYNLDFSQLAEPPWTSIQTHAQPGYYEPSTPVQQSSDGRVALVGAPDGVGKALRFELDNGDTWPLDTSVDRSQLAMSTQATWNKSALQVGDVRWFDYEIYMPTAFDFPRTNWFTLIGIHPGGNSWGACDLGFDGVGSNSVWMTWKVAGGSTTGSTANLKYIPLWQLTNADGSKYSPSYNRRIHLVVGARFAPDNTGWLEIWVDGKNVFPRTNRPTMWAGDTSSYLKIGPYKSESSPFPSGKSVIYFTRVAIGTAQPSTS